MTKSNNPYQAPHHGEKNGTTDIYRYRNLNHLANSVVFALIVFCFARIIWSLVHVVDLIYVIPDSGLFFALAGIDTAMLFLSFLWNMIAIPLFAYRANTNLRAIGHEKLRYAPKTASACWFIPILNFYLPLQVFKEIYLETQLASDRQKGPPPTSLFFIWWICWTVGDLLSRLGNQLTVVIDPNFFEHTVFMGTVLCVFGTLLLCVASVFLVNIVWTIANQQSEFPRSKTMKFFDSSRATLS